LRNSLAYGQLKQSSPTPRCARGNPPWPVRLAAPEVAPPASASSLIAPLVAQHDCGRGSPPAGRKRAGAVSGGAPGLVLRSAVPRWRATARIVICLAVVV
ncbi:MAG: hypothetical protein Q7V20_02305, partial [Aquabacterium sp.]|nr:hypothetical protein [Aquabacterium sp.]